MNVMEGSMNKQVNGKDEKYIPLVINGGGIITQHAVS